jgi:hypothetical protein
MGGSDPCQRVTTEMEPVSVQGKQMSAAFHTEGNGAAASGLPLRNFSGLPKTKYKHGMRIWSLYLGLVLAGCFPSSAVAPDNALGTYQGTAVGGGSCSSPAAELTVTVAKSSAFGEWYLEKQNDRSQFACAWVNQSGFYASHRPHQGEMEYVIGYFSNNGATVDARIDTDACSFTGRLSRVRALPHPIPETVSSAQSCKAPSQ